jgi:hypothetical protein
VSQWHDVGRQLAALRLVPMLASSAAAAAGVAAIMLCWRAVLADLGSPLPLAPAARVYFLGQLGKYVPGGVWPVVAQMELGREHQVSRRRSAAAYVVLMVLYIASALLVGAVTLPVAVVGDVRRLRWLLLMLPVVLVALHPRVLTSGVDRGLRLTRGEPLEHPLTARGVLTALAWGGVSWLFLGVHIWLLARELGGTGGGLLPLSIGGFALAWSVGFVVLLAPAGVGPRETVLAAVFASSLPAGAPVTVAVISRLVMTFLDLVAAGVSILAARRHGLTGAAVAVQAGEPVAERHVR